MKHVLLYLLLLAFVATFAQVPTNDSKLKSSLEYYQYLRKSRDTIPQKSRDIVVWQKDVIDCSGVLKLHADYVWRTNEDSTKGHIKTLTYIELIQNGQSVIVWDTSFIKGQAFNIQAIGQVSASLDRNNFSFMAGDGYYGYLVATRYNPDTKKWGLSGFHKYTVGDSQPPRELMSLGLNTMLVYITGLSKVPQVYRLNKHGEVEVYELKKVLQRNPNIPLPGIERLKRTEEIRKKNKEGYYKDIEYIEYKAPVFDPSDY